MMLSVSEKIKYSYICTITFLVFVLVVGADSQGALVPTVGLLCAMMMGILCNFWMAQYGLLAKFSPYLFFVSCASSVGYFLFLILMGYRIFVRPNMKSNSTAELESEKTHPILRHLLLFNLALAFAWILAGLLHYLVLPERLVALLGFVTIDCIYVLLPLGALFSSFSMTDIEKQIRLTKSVHVLFVLGNVLMAFAYVTHLPSVSYYLSAGSHVGSGWESYMPSATKRALSFLGAFYSFGGFLIWAGIVFLCDRRDNDEAKERPVVVS